MDVSDDGFGIENATSPAWWTDRTQFPEYRIEQIIGKVFSPCILLVGSFGNIATIGVMRRIKDQYSSQYAILMSLAVSDFLFIQTSIFYTLPRYYFNTDTQVLHWLVCKLFFFVLVSTEILSAWLVTCVTVQRAMSITWPHKMRAVCTLRRTWMVIASIVFASCIFNIHFVLGREITSDNRCKPVAGAYFSFYINWTWVKMFVSPVIPSLCQIVGDVLLCSALFKAASTMSGTVQGSSGVASDHDDSGRRKTASKITVLCLALSVTFLILNLPVYIEEVWYNFAYINLTPRAKAKRYVRYLAFSFLLCVNSSANFFLYCITGTKFRKEFVNWVCCRSQSHPTASADYSGGKGETCK